MLKLTKKLSPKHFIISHALIFVVSLLFLAGLFYILNIQFQPLQKSPFQTGPITTEPKTLRIELEQPDEDILVFEPAVIVSGKTGPNMEVLITTDEQDLILKSKSDGSFSTLVNLDEGVNRVGFEVFDATGDSRTAERTVFYSKEKI